MALGDVLGVVMDPSVRVLGATAKQVIIQKVREAGAEHYI
jgi:hypothetical protein